MEGGWAIINKYNIWVSAVKKLEPEVRECLGRCSVFYRKDQRKLTDKVILKLRSD